MPFCNKCGNKLTKEDVFCPECGTPVSNTKSSKQKVEETTDDFKTQVRGKTPSYGILNLEKLPEGHIIDERYEIKEKVGQGGFGAVYRVYDKKMNIDKALKIIPEAIVSDEEAMADLQSEARTMISLNHNSIVRVYDFHDTGDVKYIDMEFVEGKTLTKFKLEHPNKQIPEAKVKELAVKIADGLAYAHSKGIIHKDIKPQNIMLNKEGDVKIMDFGIAETVRTSMSRIQNSSSSGTLVYMSPEQIKGKDVGKESDIYSFGAVLYELLSGHPPFYKGAIEHQILSEKPDPLKKVSDKMNELIMKCLEKDFKDRFKDFGEILTILGKKDVKYKRITTEENQLQNNPLNRYLNAFIWLILGAVIISVSKEPVWGSAITLLIGCYFLYNRWHEHKIFEIVIYWIGMTVLFVIIFDVNIFDFYNPICGSVFSLAFGTFLIYSQFKMGKINSYIKVWIYQNIVILISSASVIERYGQQDFNIWLLIVFSLFYINTIVLWILSKEKGKRKKRIIISVGIILLILLMIFIVPITIEAIAWDKANKIDTIESYNHYLLKYPETKRARFDSRDSITMQELSNYFSVNFLESLDIANYYAGSRDYVFSEDFNYGANDWYDDRWESIRLSNKAVLESCEADSMTTIKSKLSKRLVSYILRFEMDVIRSTSDSGSGISVLGFPDEDSSSFFMVIYESELTIILLNSPNYKKKEYNFIHSINLEEKIIVEAYVLRDKIKVFINSNFIAEVENKNNAGIYYLVLMSRGRAKSSFDNITIYPLRSKN